jgi:hypothetical protein
LKLIRTTRLKS